MSLFVVFEGITGSGKKTQIKFLADKLAARGKKIAIITFPDYEDPIARLTRSPDLDNHTVALLHAADRAHQQQRIKGLLESDNVVICDRYSYSNFAYQAAKGVDMNWLMNLEKKFLKPDFVFLVDVPISVSMGRVQQLNIEDFTKKEIISRLQREKDFLEKIRENYLYLAKNNPDKETQWFVIDGTEDINKTHEQIWNIVAPIV